MKLPKNSNAEPKSTYSRIARAMSQQYILSEDMENEIADEIEAENRW